MSLIEHIGSSCLAVLIGLQSRQLSQLGLALTMVLGFYMADANCENSTPSQITSASAFPYVLAKRGCTQEDAPALEIIASQTPYTDQDTPKPPYIRFELAISAETTQQTSVTYALTPLLRNPELKTILVRGQLVESLLNRQWLSGSITLDHIIPGQDLSGSYSVNSADQRLWQMEFHAKYLNNKSVCG